MQFDLAFALPETGFDPYPLLLTLGDDAVLAMGEGIIVFGLPDEQESARVAKALIKLLPVGSYRCDPRSVVGPRPALVTTGALSGTLSTATGAVVAARHMPRPDWLGW